VETSSIIFFGLVSCANGPPGSTLGSRRPTHIVTDLAPGAIFSTMQCVGIDGRDFKHVGSEVAVSGTCWIQDVCYETDTEALLFFSEFGAEPWQFSEYDDYRLPILSTKPSPMNLGRISFRMVKRVGPLARAGEEVSYLDAESSVLYSPLAPWAWGLFLVENLWAVFMMQHTFGMVSAGAQIISAFDCEGLGLLYSQLGPHWSSPMRLSRCARLLRSRSCTRLFQEPVCGVGRVQISGRADFGGRIPLAVSQLHVGRLGQRRDLPACCSAPGDQRQEWAP
jgi:hypothetical protein